MINKQVKTVVVIILLLLVALIATGCEEEDDPNCLRYETETTVIPMYNAALKMTTLQTINKRVCVEWKEEEVS